MMCVLRLYIVDTSSSLAGLCPRSCSCGLRNCQHVMQCSVSVIPNQFRGKLAMEFNLISLNLS